MNHRLLVPTAFALLSLLAGCGDSGSTTGGVDCSTVKGYSAINWSKCTSCHDSSLVGPGPRQAAPDNANYDTFEGASAEAAKIPGRITDGTMPPSDQPQLTDSEKTDILTWAQCDTPQ